MSYNAYLSKDCYKILGVSRDASTASIKKAHAAIVKKYHPDKVQKEDGETEEAFSARKAESESIFKDAQQAYEVLNDSDLRQRLDRNLGFAEKNEHMPPGSNDGPEGNSSSFDSFFQWLYEWLNQAFHDSQRGEEFREAPKTNKKAKRDSGSHHQPVDVPFEDYFPRNQSLAGFNPEEFQRYYCRTLFSLLMTQLYQDSDNRNGEACVAGYGEFPTVEGRFNFGKPQEIFVFRSLKMLQKADKLLGGTLENSYFGIHQLSNLMGGVCVRTNDMPGLAQRSWAGSQKLAKKLVERILPKADYSKASHQEWDDFVLHHGIQSQIEDLMYLIELAENRIFARVNPNRGHPTNIVFRGYNGSIEGFYFFNDADGKDAQRFARFMGEPWGYISNKQWDSLSYVPYVSFPGDYAGLDRDMRALYQKSIEDAVAKAVLMLRAKGFEIPDPKQETKNEITRVGNTSPDLSRSGREGRLL